MYEVVFYGAPFAVVLLAAYSAVITWRNAGHQRRIAQLEAALRRANHRAEVIGGLSWSQARRMKTGS